MESRQVLRPGAAVLLLLLAFLGCQYRMSWAGITPVHASRAWLAVPLTCAGHAVRAHDQGLPLLGLGTSEPGTPPAAGGGWSRLPLLVLKVVAGTVALLLVLLAFLPVTKAVLDLLRRRRPDR